MKLSKIYKHLLALLVLPFVLVMCEFVVAEIIHPEDAKIDTEIEITVKLRLESEDSRTSKMVFGILAPTSWNIAQNAELRLTTTGYLFGNAENEKLTLMSPDEVITDESDDVSNPQKGKTWAEGFKGRFGTFNNTVPVEWVIYESETIFHNTDSDAGDKKVHGVVKIKLLTGSENVTVNMGYAFCAKNYNFVNSGSASKELVVTGQALPEFKEQLTTVPEEFGYGDFFSLKFEAVSDDMGTSALAGEDNVYLCGKAILSGGQIVEINETGDRTLMEKAGETTWQKYIYPKDFFGLPEGAVIATTYFYFTNADGSVVEDNSGAGFEILENR